MSLYASMLRSGIAPTQIDGMYLRDVFTMLDVMSSKQPSPVSDDNWY